MTTAPPPATSPSDEPFRPRRGRRVAQIGIVVAVVLFGFVAVLMPGADQGGNWTIVDRVLLWGLGWGMALLLQRYVRIGAWPGPDALVIRNLFLTQSVPWADIEDIRFGGGEPWVSLELVYGESVAVMAIQRADAAYGMSEAERLTALIRQHQDSGAVGGP